MSKGSRNKKKMMQDVKRASAIRQQAQLRERPFRSLIYRGKKAARAAGHRHRGGGGGNEREGKAESDPTNEA